MNISPIKIALTPLYQHPGRKTSHFMGPPPKHSGKQQSGGRLERRKIKSQLRKGIKSDD